MMGASAVSPAVGSAGRGAPDGRSTRALSLVSVRIGAQEFGLDIMAVREIRGWSRPTPLARAPAYVSGMCELRGVVIPIIDLGARLGLDPIEAKTTSVIIVVEIRRRLAGLLVDAVNDLIDADGERVQPTPETGSLEPNAVIHGVIEIDGRIVSLISLENVIPLEMVGQAPLAS